MKDATITSHQNCTEFPATQQKEKLTFEELLKRQTQYPVYLQDFNVDRCPALQKFANTILSVLQQLLDGDLLPFHRKKPNHPFFLKDRRTYTYINRYLYFGGEGTGTPLHWVSLHSNSEG